MLQNILGQPYAVQVLQNALESGRLAGSYLFVGPDGVGKATAAREFAKSLCGAESDADPIARRIDQGTNPDVRATEPTGASRTIRISQLWPRDGDSSENAMLRDLSYEPIAGQKRVFLINGAEGLNGASGNSLLKTLEEPPSYAHFILTSPSSGSVLPTIVSRCQVIPFGLLPAEAIENALVSRFQVAPAQAHFLASYCEGRLGRAVSLARSPELLAGRDTLLDLAHELITAPAIHSFRLSEEFRKHVKKLKSVGEDETDGEEKETGARQPVMRGLDLVALYYRDLLAMRLLGPDHAPLINIDRKKQLSECAPKIDPQRLEDSLTLLTGMRRAIERNANVALALDTLFSHLTAAG